MNANIIITQIFHLISMTSKVIKGHKSSSYWMVYWRLPLQIVWISLYLSMQIYGRFRLCLPGSFWKYHKLCATCHSSFTSIIHIITTSHTSPAKGYNNKIWESAKVHKMKDVYFLVSLSTIISYVLLSMYLLILFNIFWIDKSIAIN